MFSSHYSAGSGAVLVETREESRMLRDLLAELPERAEVMTVAAPNGQLRDARTGRALQGQGGLAAGYNWTSDRPGRVLVVWDWHMLANSPGHWRMLIEALPGLRRPKNSRQEDLASLVVFVGPSWDLQVQNPLRGALPLLQFDPPDRATLAAVAEKLHPTNGMADQVADALAGLSADAAEQAAAECLAAHGAWNTNHLRQARRQLLKDAGLEIWTPVADLGGLSGIKSYAEAEVFPWLRNPKLSVRRILCAGVPGVGKSYCAKWFAHRLQCECARLSVPALKAGLVGASEANLRRALRTVNALAKEAPLVLVLDEVDKVATEGLDGGTSSGMFAELLTWLQESTAQAVVIATLNRLDKLDAALESRFAARFFFELPTAEERRSVARIHYADLGCEPDCLDLAADSTAELTESFSSRELAINVAPSVLRQSNCRPDADVIRRVVASCTPASRTQEVQLAAMRNAASTLRRANDEPTDATPSVRRVHHN